MNFDTSKKNAEMVTGIYRNMPVTEKVRRIFSAYEMGKNLALAGLRSRFPNACEDELWHLWAQQHLGKQLYDQVYGTAAYE